MTVMNGRFFKYVTCIVSAALCFSGCIREDLENTESLMIRFCAKVGNVLVGSAVTKAEPASGYAGYDYDYSGSLDISIIRWDENSGNHSPAGREEFDAVLGIPAAGSWTRDIDVTPPQFYQDRDAAVGFAGWYPRSSSECWIKEDGRAIHSDNTMICSIDGTTDVMISTFESGTYVSGIPALEFRHALCLFNIYAYAVDAETAENWGTVSSVTLTNLPEQVEISLPDDIRKSGDFLFDYIGSVPKTILSGGAVELQAGSPTPSGSVHIGSFLGGGPENGVLGIKAVTSNYTSGNSVSIARNFRPGHAYNIFLKFSTKGIINAEVSSADWKYDPDKEYQIEQNFDLLSDLSRYGTANSYIISSANRGYCFTGNVKGNGTSGNTLTDRDGSDIILDPDVYLDVASVKIVRSDAVMMKNQDGSWSFVPEEERADTTKHKLITLLSNTLSDGRVVFRACGNQSDTDDISLQYKGNVKIAALDKDGNIIWSWHIWVTDRPQNQGYSNGYVALDRNLGAFRADVPASSGSGFSKDNIAWVGLYYQFGRKDPMFPAPVESGTQWGDVDEEQHPVSIDRQVSVAESVRKPMTYFYDGTGVSGNWTDDPNSAHFWGYVSARDNIKKTIYDPCPPGYRVPGNPLWEDYSSDMTWQDYGERGYTFNIGDAVSIYYPCTSCMVSDGSGVKVSYSDRTDGHDGNYVYLYSATPDMPYSGDDTGRAYHFSYSSGEAYSSVMTADPATHHVNRSDAYPVRCVFENSTPVVTDLSENQTANCYVVSGTGYYKFKADVRGNGVGRLNVVEDGSVYAYDIDAYRGVTISEIDHVDILWWQGDLADGSHFSSTVVPEAKKLVGSDLDGYLNAQCPVTVVDGGSLEDGYVMLYVRSNKNTYGNVGLAAYKDDGTILWTWHIWLQPEIEVVTMGDYTLMDRNLGATFVPSGNEKYSDANIAASYGFCYQWGRKDPFFQPLSSNSSGRNTQVWFEKSFDGNWTINSGNKASGRKSIPESWEEPLCFYTSGQNTWQTTYPSGAGGAVNNLWGYVASTNSDYGGSSFAKTMYDPCPPGYRVMQHDVFESANICKANDQDKYTFDRTDEYGIYFDNSISIDGRGNAIAGGIWFPNSRGIDSECNYNDSETYRLHTATAFESTGSSDASREIRWKKTEDRHWAWIDWEYEYYYEIQQNTSNNWQTDGRVVRCQME